MQTFLPYASYEKSASVLDRLRLGKQRVEAITILRVLEGTRPGWERHPAVLMWQGYEESLCWYGIAICEEWKSRGYIDAVMPEFLKALDRLEGSEPEIPHPWWLGWRKLHSSHRAALLAKDTEWYSQFGWDEWPEIDYHWPNRSEGIANGKNASLAAR